MFPTVEFNLEIISNPEKLIYVSTSNKKIWEFHLCMSFKTLISIIIVAKHVYENFKAYKVESNSC